MSQAPIDLQHYDPMERSIQQDPFPWYEALQRDAPIFQHPVTRMFSVSRMDDVLEVLADTATYSSRFASLGALGPSAGDGAAADGFGPPTDTMLTADPPAQTRYRKTVGKAFSTRRILELEPRIREI